MYCSKCGSKLNDDALFCYNCGLKIEKIKKFCRICGEKITPDTKYCIKCGEPVYNIDELYKKQLSSIKSYIKQVELEEQALYEKRLDILDPPPRRSDY